MGIQHSQKVGLKNIPKVQKDYGLKMFFESNKHLIPKTVWSKNTRQTFPQQISLVKDGHTNQTSKSILGQHCQCLFRSEKDARTNIAKICHGER